MNDVPKQRSAAAPHDPGIVYLLGLIGAMIWFWNQADGAGEHVVGLLKGFVWPAYLVYDAFQALHG